MRRFLFLPSTRIRPSVVLKPCRTPIQTRRTLYIRPKPRHTFVNHSAMIRNKETASTETTNLRQQNFERMKQRILETGGNLKLVEVLYLDSKCANDEASHNEYNVSKKSSRKSILAELSHQKAMLRNVVQKMSPVLLRDGKVQRFLILELVRLKKQNEIATLETIWSIIKPAILKQQFTGADEKHVLKLDTNGQGFIKSLTELSLFVNNLEIASGLILNNEVDGYITKSVINSLIVKNPRYEESTIEMILKICEKKNYFFSHYENTEILSNKFEYLNLFLQKKFLEYIINHTSYITARNTVDDVKLQNYYRLIDINFRLNNISGSYITWAKIQIEFPSMKIHDHDVKILSKLLKIFNKSKDYYVLSNEIIESLKPFEKLNKDQNNEILLQNIISFSAKTSNVGLINELVNSMNPPFQRRTLTELLRVNLTFKESPENIQTLLKQIMENFGTLSPLENSIIVKSLIKGAKFREALVFVDNLDLKSAKNSYLTIIDHLINRSQGELKPNQLIIIHRFLSNVQNRNLDEFYDFKKDTFWPMVSSMFFKYLSLKQENLGALKRLYSSSNKNITNKLYYLDDLSIYNEVSGAAHVKKTTSNKLDHLRLNPFENPDSARFLLINDETKIVMLRTILNLSIRAKDTRSISWCFKEMNDLGLSKLEIIVDASKTFSKKVGFNDLKSTTIDRFKNYWYENSPRFIRNNRYLKSLN